MNQTLENGKKPSSGPNFDPFDKFGSQFFFLLLWILPLLEIGHCCKLSLYAISRKTNEPTWENGKKQSFEPDFSPFDPNSDPQSFFFKNWLRRSLDIMVSYHHVQYQKKLMAQSWENLVTDGKTDEDDFIGRCPTNAERTIYKPLIYKSVKTRLCTTR